MTIGDILTVIPVYPDSVKLKGSVLDMIPSNVKICEDDLGNVSFMDEKSKTESLKGRTFSGRKPVEGSNRNNKWEAFGQTKSLMKWAEEYGINHKTLRGRVVRCGMTLEKALTYKFERRQ